MDRFSSSKLRIGWVLVCLFLTGLVFMAIQGKQSEDGSQLILFGAAVPLGMDTLTSYVIGNLRALMYWIVPLVILLCGFAPLGAMIAASARGERFKGLFVGLFMAFLHGIFFSQLLLLPMWAACYRLLGAFFPGELLKADLLAVFLGLQLLLWSTILMRLFRSNVGLGLLLTLLLREVGSRLSYFVDFGLDMGMSERAVKAVTFLMRLLPSGQLPSDPFSGLALPISIGGPLVIAMLLMLLPVNSGKASKKAKA
jgi:fumarate reductase subunit D